MLSAFGVEHIAKADRKYKRDAGGRFAKIDQRKFKGTFKFVDEPEWNQQINADLERIVKEPVDENLPSWIRDSQREKDDSTLLYLKWLDSPSGPFSESYGDTKGTWEVGQFLDNVTGTTRDSKFGEDPKRIHSEAAEPLREEFVEQMREWNSEKNLDWNHDLIDFYSWRWDKVRAAEDKNGEMVASVADKDGVVIATYADELPKSATTSIEDRKTASNYIGRGNDEKYWGAYNYLLDEMGLVGEENEAVVNDMMWQISANPWRGLEENYSLYEGKPLMHIFDPRIDSDLLRGNRDWWGFDSSDFTKEELKEAMTGYEDPLLIQRLYLKAVASGKPELKEAKYSESMYSRLERINSRKREDRDARAIAEAKEKNLKESSATRYKAAERVHNYYDKSSSAQKINQMQNEQKYRGLNDNNHVGGMWEYPNKEAWVKAKNDPENKHLYGIEKAAHLREVIKKNFSSAFGIQTYA